MNPLTQGESRLLERDAIFMLTDIPGLVVAALIQGEYFMLCYMRSRELKSSLRAGIYLTVFGFALYRLR